MKALIDVRHAGRRGRALLVGGAALVLCAAGAGAVAGVARASTNATASSAVPAAGCTASSCTFSLSVNPGLTPGHTFACPAIQSATASITVSNRFATGALNDSLKLVANGLPANTGFDLFLVQHSPFDTNFSGFGFGWYQSDVESDSSGHASVTVRGIFDKETFIVKPSSTAPVHTFNVGFWFDSPTTEASKCGSPTPAATPFNGEQNAGLLAMITQGAPLGTVH
jgi:hypothetical protein